MEGIQTVFAGTRSVPLAISGRLLLMCGPLAGSGVALLRETDAFQGVKSVTLRIRRVVLGGARTKSDESPTSAYVRLAQVGNRATFVLFFARRRDSRAPVDCERVTCRLT
jgi:hypothetical protein